jgi:mycoredoxin
MTGKCALAKRVEDQLPERPVINPPLPSVLLPLPNSWDGPLVRAGPPGPASRSPVHWPTRPTGASAADQGVRPTRRVMPRFELYGTKRCPYTSEMRDWLEFRRCEFVKYDVESDPAALGRIVQIGWQGRSCIVAGPAEG